MHKGFFRTSISLILAAVMLLSGISFQAVTASAEEASAEHSVTAAYYGRAALAELENSVSLQYAYDQMVAGVTSNSEQITVCDATHLLSWEEVCVAWDAYTRDHPEHFWVYGSLGGTQYSDGRIEIKPPYMMTGAALTEARAAFSQEVDSILVGITADMSEYEKELYLHDALAAHITYVDGAYAHTAYGALVEGKAVCDGYAKALQYLLQCAGVQSFLVSGKSEDPNTETMVGHAWNLVRIDGEYYHTDLTWDDQESDLYHAYFNQTDAVIAEDHIVDAAAYALPKCTAVTAQYFTGTDAYLDTYSVNALSGLLVDGDLSAQVYVPGDVAEFVQWIGDNRSAIAASVGVQDGFSYRHSQCGRELHLEFMLNFKVTSGSGISYFMDISNALATCSTGSTLCLRADYSGDITVGKEISLDLNGFDIVGDVGANAAVTIYDSETDDYTVLNGDGYGRITGTISGMQPEEGYLMIEEDDGLSFHKVNVALESVGVRSSVAGLYYTGTFAYDEVVKQNLFACGVTLSTTNTEPVVDAEDETCLYTRSPKTLLTDIMSETEKDAINYSNARKLVYGRAYLMLQDGTCVYSKTSATRLKTLVETIDRSVWNSLSKTQKDGLVDMYKTYSGVMTSWDVDNIKSAL